MGVGRGLGARLELLEGGGEGSGGLVYRLVRCLVCLVLLVLWRGGLLGVLWGVGEGLNLGSG